MFDTVQIYDPEPAAYPDGHRHPACALIEDEEGVRWLLSAQPQVRADHWRRAARAGAAALVSRDSGGGWLVASAQVLAATRAERDGLYTSWTGRVFPEFPDWIDLRELEQASPAPRADTSGFVNLHTHTEYSPLDGMSRMGPLVDAVAAMGAGAVGITDHGTCAGHPELQTRALAAGLNPVFGIEAYLVDDIAARGDQHGYWHLVLLAADDEGLKNLWGASTEAYQRGFYGKPRMDWEMLSRYSGGVFATTACLGGPVSQAILAGDTLAAEARLARLYEAFDQRLMVEIHANTTADQRKVNTELVRLAHLHRLPLIAAADSHYVHRADADRHEVWMACQTNKVLGEDTGMFNEGASFHLHTEQDMRQSLDYLPGQVVDEAMKATVTFGQMATARITTARTLPLYTKAASVQSALDADAQALRQLAEANWSKIENCPDQQGYRDRFEREMGLIGRQKFCGYFMMVAAYCRWAKENKILVGPGRGSGGGCLVAYLTGITEIDPVRWGLSFERFLTEGRTSLPDFDVDFPESKRAQILGHLRARFGADHVVTIGTHMRLKSKAVIAELGRALRAELPPTAFVDLKTLSDFIKEAESGTAGLGLSWEALWGEHAEVLEPYRTRYPRLFALADDMVGLLKSYGRHPAGTIISTGGPLTGSLPLRSVTEDGQAMMVTQFDAHGVEDLGYVKFDILTLRTLDTIQAALDGIEARWGHRLDLYDFDLELEDPQVWDLICSGHVLGCFQIETSLGANLVRQMAPRCLPELADAITLVRPGPRNSGLTKEYLARRAGDAQIRVPDPRLAEVLAPTYGVIIYQEQVLAVCRTVAGYDDGEAEDIRKILGKKLVEAVDAAGRDFVARAVSGGMDHGDARILWEQMAEFSKYAFGKAHAHAYALLAYWTAFLKVHFPVEFAAAALSTVDKDRIPVFVKEARRMGVPVLPPDVNTSGVGFSSVGDAVRYGVDSLKGLGDSAAAEITAHQPYTSVQDFASRTGRAVTKGTVRLLARAGAFDTLEPHRAALVARLDAEKSGASTRCVFKDDGVEEGLLPCGYDWDGEPASVNPRTGKTLPRKAPPKKCTIACRRYTAPAPVDPQAVAPYTDAQIGAIELDLFGFYLTVTPFDRLDAEDRAWCRGQAELAADGTPGEYGIAALVERAHPYLARTGTMGFLTLGTEGPDLEATCFTKLWAAADPEALVGRLVLATVKRNDRGLTIETIDPI